MWAVPQCGSSACGCPERTEKLYTYPGRAQELATVRRALRTETARQQWEGSFVLPAKGRFSTPFGVKRIRNGRSVGYHRGLDIAAPIGTPIHAAAAGRVVLARSLKMHGKTVVVDHGLGVTSLYLHQSALRCREGQAWSGETYRRDRHDRNSDRTAPPLVCLRPRDGGQPSLLDKASAVVEFP